MSLKNRTLVLTDYRTYERLDAFISQNHDSVLGLVSYTAALLAEIIKHYPTLKSIVYKILYRFKLISNKKQEFTLTEKQTYYYNLMRKIYGYIVDIRIAASVFNFIPYVAKFFKLYSSPSKLKKNINSYQKVVDFLQYAFLFKYTVYELFGFLTSHDMLDRDFIAKYTLMKQHREDKDYDKSDYLYVYSCAFWFYYNLVTLVDTTIVKHEMVDWHFIVDTLMSYHWGTKYGLFNKEWFAVLGFANTFGNFKKLLK